MRMNFTQHYSTVYGIAPYKYTQNGFYFDRAGYEVDEEGIRISDEEPIRAETPKPPSLKKHRPIMESVANKPLSKSQIESKNMESILEDEVDYE